MNDDVFRALDRFTEVLLNVLIVVYIVIQFTIGMHHGLMLFDFPTYFYVGDAVVWISMITGPLISTLMLGAYWYFS